MAGTGLDFADFDRYCDEHGIRPGEEPAAFAAWLHAVSGGRWDGNAEQISRNDDRKEAGPVSAFERVRGNAIYTPSELAERAEAELARIRTALLAALDNESERGYPLERADYDGKD